MIRHTSKYSNSDRLNLAECYADMYAPKQMNESIEEEPIQEPMDGIEDLSMIEDIHGDLTNGQVKDAIEKIKAENAYTFFDDYREYLAEHYPKDEQLEYFQKATIAYFKHDEQVNEFDNDVREMPEGY